MRTWQKMFALLVLRKLSTALGFGLFQAII
jgi:hypothetical protein